MMNGFKRAMGRVSRPVACTPLQTITAPKHRFTGLLYLGYAGALGFSLLSTSRVRHRAVLPRLALPRSAPWKVMALPGKCVTKKMKSIRSSWKRQGVRSYGRFLLGGERDERSVETSSYKAACTQRTSARNKSCSK